MVELLTVILIVAVLVVIAIPWFLRQRERSWEAQARATLRNAATAVESHGTENQGDYSAANTVADLEEQGFRPTTDIGLAITSNPTDYRLVASHSNLSCSWVYESASGVPQRSSDCVESDGDSPLDGIMDTIDDLLGP